MFYMIKIAVWYETLIGMFVIMWSNMTWRPWSNGCDYGIVNKKFGEVERLWWNSINSSEFFWYWTSLGMSGQWLLPQAKNYIILHGLDKIVEFLHIYKKLIIFVKYWWEPKVLDSLYWCINTLFSLTNKETSKRGNFFKNYVKINCNMLH
jgi:hypothetical protein